MQVHFAPEEEVIVIANLAKSLVSQMFCGRDRHSAAPMKQNDFWPKEDRLGGRLSWEDEVKRVL